jgi:hypothetical protein
LFIFGRRLEYRAAGRAIEQVNETRVLAAIEFDDPMAAFASGFSLAYLSGFQAVRSPVLDGVSENQVFDHRERGIVHRLNVRAAKAWAVFPSNSKRAAREFFLRGDSRINGNMIHAGDGDFGVAFVGA